MSWAVVISRPFEGRNSEVVGLLVDVGDTVKVLEKTSEKWWLCSDGCQETGYLPPSCLLVTYTEGDMQGSVSSGSDTDIISILKYETSEEESSAGTKRSNQERKVQFKPEHTVHIIKKNHETEDIVNSNYTEPILQDEPDPDKKSSRKKKVSFGFSKQKSYGYFVNPLYNKSYKPRDKRCNKDVCHYCKTKDHVQCYDFDFEQQSSSGSSPNSRPGFIASSLGFVSDLCGRKEGGGNMSGFNLMGYIVSE